MRESSEDHQGIPRVHSTLEMSQAIIGKRQGTYVIARCNCQRLFCLCLERHDVVPRRNVRQNLRWLTIDKD